MYNFSVLLLWFEWELSPTGLGFNACLLTAFRMMLEMLWSLGGGVELTEVCYWEQVFEI